jgi:hypothetical protein
MLNITPPDRMTDQQGRPYFLWDLDMDLATFQAKLRDADPAVRAYFLGKLMRQARPDDVFAFVSPRDILQAWPLLERYLGKTRGFWSWLFAQWEDLGLVHR